MKSTIIVGLSALLLSGITALPASAQYPENQTYPDRSYDIRREEAFNLVSSAYRGAFEEQGIPSYYRLQHAYQAGEVTAEEVIRGAIRAGELSPQAIEDEDYVSAVEFQLNALTQAN
ncbi:conserved hypothetical protein [Gloeothece citriformis PCC 7424]|uniref:Uncharacterized protein n=1 Tax=Gloeothece citriformis (strain PCC 7424) TaxID=65393 RepID=B7K8Z7_GLOC7|nr:hypothetical protein [Gloeothece citriformis]ACK72766.1 conserved hypothetical protein [Gloeothece citriformis PCC 7424]